MEKQYVIIFKNAKGDMDALLNLGNKSLKVMGEEEMKIVSLQLMFPYQVIELNLTNNP